MEFATLFGFDAFGETTDDVSEFETVRLVMHSSSECEEFTARSDVRREQFGECFFPCQ